MKHTEKKGYSTKGVHRLCDPNVYKLVPKKEGQTIRQLFRNVLSSKIYKPNDPKNKENFGIICKNLSPSTQIVQVRGNEPIIEKSEWSKIFKVQEEKQPTAKPNIELTKELCDLSYNDNLIMMEADDIIELLNEFPPEYDNFKNIATNFLHSPYDQ